MKGILYLCLVTISVGWAASGSLPPPPPPPGQQPPPGEQPPPPPPSGLPPPPTCSQIDAMKKGIKDYLNQNGQFRPTVLRLAFHDCVGGCDGCINTNDASNAGLAEVTSGLAAVYKTKNFASFGASLADFFALAGTVAVVDGINKSNMVRTGGTGPGPCPVPRFRLFWGRKDTLDCSNAYPTFPSAEMTADEMYDYFKNDFGFSKNQVVALLGAHSMGGAKVENSGYRFSFTPGQEHEFDERYYKSMFAPDWYATDFTPPEDNGEWQFTNSKNALMLNTDFELAYNLTLNSETEEPTCHLNALCGFDNSCEPLHCPKSSTFNTVVDFSNNCPAFIQAFQDVFERMLLQGSNINSLTSNPC